jgi:ABC-type glycerol-3-phosphate transport system substrate-binding protein
MTSVAALGLLAACGSGSAGSSTTSSGSGGSQVTLKVVSLKPGSEDSAFKAFAAQVTQFEAANPNIKITSEEYEWTGPTFAAQLAGGTLPDVFTIPFTDGKTLIQNKQLANLDAEFQKLPYAGDFNPKVLAAGQGEDGKVYGIPYAAYGTGLQYNRTLFAQAGLDPDKPPTTWDEVRADAKQIAQKTGQAGYATMTQSNTGGWQLTVATNARGGRVETIDGTKATATLDNPATKASLEYLKQLRWDDNSMGSNFLYDWSGINQAFAAGQIGMYTGGSDVYTSLVTSNAIKPADYGLTTLPLEGSDAGVLGGGTLAAVNAKASDQVKAAAVKWIDFYYMRKLTDQAAAVLDAKTLSDAKQPVGTPSLPIFDRATYDTSLTWIKDYVNIPTAQVKSFNDGIFDQPLVDEPGRSTQQLYAALDTVVQAVLTDKNADIDALLTKANTDVQALLDKG